MCIWPIDLFVRVYVLVTVLIMTEYEIRHAARRVPGRIYARRVLSPHGVTASHFGHHQAPATTQPISTTIRYPPSTPCSSYHIDQTSITEQSSSHGTRNTLPRRSPTEPRLPLYARPATGPVPLAAPHRPPVWKEEPTATAGARAGTKTGEPGTVTGRNTCVDEEGSAAEDADADRLCVVVVVGGSDGGAER